MAWNIQTSSQVEPDLEILVQQVNVDVAPSIVLDASAVAPNADGDRILLSGTPLVKNLNNQYQAYNGATADNDVQTIAVDGTGGAWVPTHAANAAAALDWDATAAEVKAALEALASISVVEVTRSARVGTAYTYTVTFTEPSEAGPITATDTLTGGAGTVTVTQSTTVAGTILGILNRTEKFPDGLAHSDIASAMWNHGQWFRADRIVGWASNQSAIRAALPTCKFS